MKSKFAFGIRAKFFAAFFISLLAGLLVFLTINGTVRGGRTDYSREIEAFNKRCLPVMEDIRANYADREKLQKIIGADSVNNAGIEAYITDKYGNVLLKPPGSSVAKLAPDPIIGDQDNRASQSGRIRYARAEALPDGNLVIFSAAILKSDEILPAFAGMIVFIAAFFLLTYGTIRYIKALAASLAEISGGDLAHKAAVKGKDELAMLAGNINSMTDELSLRRQKEERLEKTKNELIVNMSHDLRTPLTSIIGYTQLLKEKHPPEDELKSCIDIIDAKARRLETMIGDLFEYAALADCGEGLQKVRVSLNELLRQIVEGMLPVGTRNGISIVYSAPARELMVTVDAEKVARVFENILMNAVKYSEKPGIVEVTLCRDGEKAVAGIYNKGRTLSGDELARVFDRFYRTDGARNSETGGAGIGLSIARSIVELHGGAIWAECGGGGLWFKVAFECGGAGHASC